MTERAEEFASLSHKVMLKQKEKAEWSWPFNSKKPWSIPNSQNRPQFLFSSILSLFHFPYIFDWKKISILFTLRCVCNILFVPSARTCLRYKLNITTVPLTFQVALFTSICIHIYLNWFSPFPSPNDVVLHCCYVPLRSLSAYIRSVHAISSSQTGHACCLLHPVCACATESIYETNFYIHTYDKSGTSHLLPDFDPSFLSLRMIILFSSAYKIEKSLYFYFFFFAFPYLFPRSFLFWLVSE